MSPVIARGPRVIRLGACVGLLLGLLLAFELVSAQQPAPGSQAASSVGRLSLRISSPTTARTVSGIISAVDSSGLAVSDLSPDALQTSVDGKPVQLNLLPGRPSIALAAAFLLDSSASPRVRDAVANALADGLQGIDVNRDTVAIIGTADSTPWDQATFTTSADDLKQSLNQIIRTTPNDSRATLDQVFGALRLLNAQTRDAHTLLLVTNRPLASAASVDASLGTIRSFASDNAIQVNIVALPGAGGQGPAEALAEATPGGRVEYVLNATNRPDISRRVNRLLSPVFGAHRFEFQSPVEGTHTLSVGAPGVTLPATASFQVAARAAAIDSLQTANGQLKAGDQITEPTWIEPTPAENVPIDSVEWTVDGRVTQVTSEPWALLIDPEQLGDGGHDVSARIVSRGHAGPLLTTTVFIPTDFLRSIRNAVRNWGLIALLLVGELIVLILFLRVSPTARSSTYRTTDFPPTLRLNPLTGRYVAPEVIEFPTNGKLRIGYHPPFMDNQVGSRDFSRLPFQDIRGDEEAVKDLSRHAACIWRDPKTNDCYIQLGWNGAGEAIKPKPQSQVFHFGRPQDAVSGPFRLAHHDVVRLGTGVEFVFNQVGLRDKATPESKKLSPFELRSTSPAKVAVMAEATHRPGATQETLAEDV